jgi:hypothetical protein
VRALFEQCLLPLASNVDAAFVALLAAHVPLVHDAALALRLSGEALRPSWTSSAIPSRTRAAMRCCCAASTKWAWPAFDDARLLNKKRREADVLRCVHRCQRGEYVFAPQRRNRPLSLARARAV